MAGRGAALDEGVVDRDVGGRAVALGGGEEQQPELVARGQAGGLEVPARGDLGGGDGGSNGRRRRAGQRLGVAGVVGEAHLHLDRRALVGRHQRVGARRRRGDVRLSVVGGHPDPLVRVADAGQPVGIHDGGGDRRQRLPDLRCAGDRRRARRGGVGRRRDDDIEFVADRPAVAVAGGHLHGHRPRGRWRAREGARAGGEGQPRGQRRVVGFRRRVGQGVAGVRVAERGVREHIAERRACRRRLVRNRVRHRRRVVGGRPACPPDREKDAKTVATRPGGVGDVVLETRRADAPSRCRAAVQGRVADHADNKPRAIGRGGIARDHPVGRAGAQRGVGRGREDVDGISRERARIGHGGQQGARIVAGVPINLDHRGGSTRGHPIKIYPDAGQRVGAGARGELCGSNQGCCDARLPGVADEGRDRLPGGLGSGLFLGLGRRRGGGAHCVRLCSVTDGAQRYDRIVVGRLRCHGVVRVLRADASRVLFDGGQAVDAGAPQDPVSGYPLVLWVVPGEGQDAVANTGQGEPGGRRWRVVIFGLLRRLGRLLRWGRLCRFVHNPGG